MPFWPTGTIVQVPTWITSSQTATTSTTGPSYFAVWPSQTTSAATNTMWYTPTESRLYSQAYAQGLTAQDQRWQDLYQTGRYQSFMARQSALGQLYSPNAPPWAPSAPAIITPQEAERRDRQLYERAVQQHDQQEQERLLREIERHGRLAAEERRLVEERAQAAREEQERRTVAKARARELLVEYLTPQQRETFDANGWFVVEGGKSKTKYRIRALESMVANVDVLNAGGAALHRLCAHVRVGTVPLGDQLLAQKIMLELAEDDFLRTAIRHAA